MTQIVNYPFLKLAAAAAALVLSAANASAGTSQYYPHEKAGTPYSKVVRAGDLVFVSGQVGAGPDGLAKGLDAQVKQAMDNVAANLKAVGLGMEDVVKCQVFMTDITKLEDLSKIYVTYFQPGRLPARTSVGVSGLPRGADVEMDCIAMAK